MGRTAGKAENATLSWDDSGEAGAPVHRQRRVWHSLDSVPWYQRRVPMPRRLQAPPNWRHAQHLKPETAQASPQAAQCTGRGSPSGSASATRAARNAAPKIWTGPNPRQTCRTQAKGCPRRGIALQPCARGRLSSGPYCTQFPYQLVTASMVRKDSPAVSVEKLRNPNDSLLRAAATRSYGAMAEFWKSAGLQIISCAGIGFQGSRILQSPPFFFA